MISTVFFNDTFVNKDVTSNDTNLEPSWTSSGGMFLRFL